MAKTKRINFYSELPKTIEDIMSKGFVDYEKSHGIDVNYQRFSIVFSDNHNNPTGVLCAYTAFAEIYIDDIWVHEQQRGQGIGRELIQTLEDKFKDQGFNNINLVTSEFQAPDFYRKCGFEQEFVRINHHNPKLTKYFFVKYFKGKNQHQGLLNKNHSD